MSRSSDGTLDVEALYQLRRSITLQWTSQRRTTTVCVYCLCVFLFARQHHKGPFIATQLNSTRRRVELSCIAIDTLTDATQLSPAIGNELTQFQRTANQREAGQSSWVESCRYKRALTRDIDIANLSVCPSVCLFITFRFLSKRLNLLSQFLHHTVAQSF